MHGSTSATPLEAEVDPGPPETLQIRVHVLYKRAEIPANSKLRAIAVSVS